MPLTFISLNEEGNGAIVGALHFLREVASGELAVFSVIVKALAAASLSGARLVSAITLL
jgi:hypothetical protein